MKVKFRNTVCFDTTHGTNAYDFFLLSIMAIHEFGEGIPVGRMVSNKEDCLVVIDFLQTVGERCGVLNTKWFMSDDAEQFFTAWRATFGDQKTQKCAWHIDRGGVSNLSEEAPYRFIPILLITVLDLISRSHATVSTPMLTLT